jgi:3D (Asp-Asp-Asp) domain-containing protein
MTLFLRLTFVAALAAFLTSCNTTSPAVSKSTAAAAHGKIQKVRTTAYTHSEKGGPRNAIGKRLSGSGVRSAASDWSRFPLGTRFRLVGTNEEYVIDDYGGALIGTETIDLYKTSRAAMRKWGVRHVDIQILHWGCEKESLKVLKPRSRVRIVRRMIEDLEKDDEPPQRRTAARG